jgi:hypothetical protein
MARQQDLEQPACGPVPSEFGDMLRTEPPAFLDALVKERMGSVLEQRRAELSEEPREAGLSPSGDIGSAEAWTYAVGFLAYGAQLADGLARMLWRAMTG